jgi:ferredoxin
VRAERDWSVAAAMLNAGIASCAAVCGMGVCMQCRVTVDGVPHVRACQTLCRDGMEVATQ